MEIEDSKGYQSLLKTVKSDCKEGQDCFNENGCDHEYTRMEKRDGDTCEHCYSVSKCFHKYCDTFKWIIDRAKHYAKKTGLSAGDILDSWEEQRDYSWNNYYQECNQPEIKGDNVRVFETREDFQFSLEDKGFRCPSCNHISQSHSDCDSGKEMTKGKICDWKSYGFFGTAGKGITVFIKETFALVEIFMPIAW